MYGMPGGLAVPGWWMLSACSGAHAGSDGPRATVAPGFWAHWGDGRAEIDSYRLTIPRYGELRTGTAVLVFVTEDFTEAQRVKSDGGHPDEYPVLKLNDIRHFQTGVYDYDVMTSTFVRIDGSAPIGVPAKVSLSVQEWCGHVYEQLVPPSSRAAEALRWTGHGYFDGEADRDEALAVPTGGILLDALPVVARGLVGAWPAPGDTVEVPVLPTLLHGRLAHVPPAWTSARVTRGAEPQSVEVPAGTFRTIDVSATLASGFTATWRVEVEAPHRIVAWSTSEGERAELVASERVAYWSMHGERDEAALAGLGLAPAPLPSPPAPLPSPAAPAATP